jgi:predicted DNA-binding transcriptional regulator AlpA
MKPKRIVREPEACSRLGCKRTKFREDYRLNDPADPNVPNTDIPRLRPIPLGVRNVGYLDGEIDQLIDGLAELRDSAPAVPRTTRVFLTDGTPPRLEQERRALLECCNRLRAQATGDPDPRIEEIERALHGKR